MPVLRLIPGDRRVARSLLASFTPLTRPTTIRSTTIPIPKIPIQKRNFRICIKPAYLQNIKRNVVATLAALPPTKSFVDRSRRQFFLLGRAMGTRVVLDVASFARQGQIRRREGQLAKGKVRKHEVETASRPKEAEFFVMGEDPGDRVLSLLQELWQI